MTLVLWYAILTLTFTSSPSERNTTPERYTIIAESHRLCEVERLRLADRLAAPGRAVDVTFCAGARITLPPDGD